MADAVSPWRRRSIFLGVHPLRRPALRRVIAGRVCKVLEVASFREGSIHNDRGVRRFLFIHTASILD